MGVGVTEGCMSAHSHTVHFMSMSVCASMWQLSVLKKCGVNCGTGFTPG